jgi:hypothetical protein
MTGVVNKTSMVRLTDDERQAFCQLTRSGKAAASKLQHAHSLLHLDANGLTWPDAHVATALHWRGITLRHVRHRCVAQGLAPMPPGWRQ